MSTGIDKKILRLDISMTDPDAMNICQRTKDLIRIKFDEDVRNFMLALSVIFDDFVEVSWNVVHDDIQINLIALIF